MTTITDTDWCGLPRQHEPHYYGISVPAPATRPWCLGQMPAWFMPGGCKSCTCGARHQPPHKLGSDRTLDMLAQEHWEDIDGERAVCIWAQVGGVTHHFDGTPCMGEIELDAVREHAGRAFPEQVEALDQLNSVRRSLATEAITVLAKGLGASHVDVGWPGALDLPDLTRYIVNEDQHGVWGQPSPVVAGDGVRGTHCQRCNKGQLVDITRPPDPTTGTICRCTCHLVHPHDDPAAHYTDTEHLGMFGIKDDGLGGFEVTQQRSCRYCGCTDEQACPDGPCSWVSDDVCIACLAAGKAGSEVDAGVANAQGMVWDPRSYSSTHGWRGGCWVKAPRLLDGRLNAPDCPDHGAMVHHLPGGGWYCTACPRTWGEDGSLRTSNAGVRVPDPVVTFREAMTGPQGPVRLTGSAYEDLMRLAPETSDPWYRSWPIHNLVAHPLGELLHWLGRMFGGGDDPGDRLHDATLPTHEAGTGRG